MALDYRLLLRLNLRALLAAKGIAADRLKACYLAGPKKGKRVSARTINYTLSEDPDKSGLGVDGLAAIAAALGVEAYHLLLPDLDPLHRPIANAEEWIENEVSRRLEARLPAAMRALKALEATRERSRGHDDRPISVARGEAATASAPGARRPKAARR